ncbi:WD40 repeat domain-containing protein [Sorangium sp. So ce834]|uniref:WD40 repeat domain-containing protein n=1 Tax=Sorangium sp. So ce834 TaxID=3133321 RepID=UPI003F62C423
MLIPQVAHPQGVNAVAFSADGGLLASGGADHAVKIWSTRTGALLRDLIGHTASVVAVAFPPGLDRVVSAGADGTVRIWNVRTGELVKTLGGHREGVTALALSPDGKTAVAASRDRRVRAWRLDGAWSATLWKVSSAVRSAAFSPDGKIVFLGQEKGSISTWDPESGRALGAYHDDKSTFGVAEIGALPGGRSALIAAYREGLLRWDLGGGPPTRAWSTGTAPIEAMTMSPDRAHVLAAIRGRGLVVYDVATGSPVRTLAQRDDSTSCVAYSPDGLHAASGGRWTLDLWDLTTAERTRSLGARVSDVSGLAVSPDGTQLLAAYRGFGARLWDLTTASLGRDFVPKEGVVVAADFLDGGRQVIAAISSPDAEYNGIRIWDARTGAAVRSMGETSGKLEEAISWTRALPDGKRALTWRILKQRIELWDIETGDLLRRAPTGDEPLALSPDGRTFVGQDNGDLHLWSAETLEPISTLEAHVDDATCAVYSRRGVLLLSGGKDATMRLWSTVDGSLLYTYYGHQHAVTALALSPDDAVIVSAASDGAVRLWRREDGSLIRTLRGHTASVTSLSFLPDGRRFLSGSTDGTVRLWTLDGDASLVLLASGSEWLTYSSEGYFDASRSGGRLVSVTHDLEAYPAWSVAARANRPDLLLQPFGLAGSSTLEVLRRRPTWLPTPGPFDGPASSGGPVVKVKRVAASERSATLEVEVRSTAPLQRYNVFVNATPLHGLGGRAVSGTRTALIERLDLGYGDNQIVVYASDGAGAVGMSPPVVVQSRHWIPPILHYVGIGVARYRDPRLRAEHADRDAIDLGAALRATEGPLVAHAKVTTWTDEEATAGVVRSLDRHLGEAAPDDVVIVLLSGRATAAVDRPETFRYLPYDADPSDLPATGLGLAELDAILARVRARHKLLLIDVKGAGSPGTSAAASAAAPGERADRRARAHERYAFNDLRRRSGTIIALCGDLGEQCRETVDGDGGLFTNELRTAFSTGAPDQDGDGQISTDELRVYLERRIAELTNGAQNPVFLNYPEWSFALPVARGPVTERAGGTP